MGRKALGKVPYTATMSEAALSRLDQEAARVSRTRSEVIEELVRLWLDSIDKLKGDLRRAKK